MSAIVIQEGLLTLNSKFVYDSYMNKIHIGARVAYNRSGEVKKGTVTDVVIKKIEDDEPWNRRNTKVRVRGIVTVEEEETNSASFVKNLKSIIVI